MVEEIIITTLYLTALTCVLVLIYQYNPSHKLSYFSNVPNINTSVFDELILWIGQFGGDK